MGVYYSTQCVFIIHHKACFLIECKHPLIWKSIAMRMLFVTQHEITCDCGSCIVYFETEINQGDYFGRYPYLTFYAAYLGLVHNYNIDTRPLCCVVLCCIE